MAIVFIRMNFGQEPACLIIGERPETSHCRQARLLFTLLAQFARSRDLAAKASEYPSVRNARCRQQIRKKQPAAGRVWCLTQY